MIGIKVKGYVTRYNATANEQASIDTFEFATVNRWLVLDRAIERVPAILRKSLGEQLGPVLKSNVQIHAYAADWHGTDHDCAAWITVRPVEIV